MINKQTPDANDDLGTILTRQRRGIFLLHAQSSNRVRSWGERFFALLFAASDASWLAIAVLFCSLISDATQPLLPLWAPFLFLIFSAWLFQFFGNRLNAISTRSPKFLLVCFYLFFALGYLAMLWQSQFQNTNFLDFGWLLDLANDFILVRSRILFWLASLLFSGYLLWRGAKINTRDPEPGWVMSSLFTGLVVIAFTLILRMLSGKSQFDFLLTLLISLFTALILLTHALAKAIFSRNSTPGSFEGNASLQEQALTYSVGVAALGLFAVGLILGGILSPLVLEQMRTALGPLAWIYDLITRGIAFIAAIVAMPFFWLISILHGDPQITNPFSNIQNDQTIQPSGSDPETPTTLNIFTILRGILVISIPLAIILVISIIIFTLVRKLRHNIARHEHTVYESIWSWQLFRLQIKQAWLRLWRRLFAQKKVSDRDIQHLLSGKQAQAKTIRELYHQFLHWLPGQELMRQQAETPSELALRVVSQRPDAQPHLNTLTHLYNHARYGSYTLTEQEFTGAQIAFSEMQKPAEKASEGISDTH